MCGLFLAVDPAAYVCETRAIRLHGHATSIRLEAAFWATLDEIAAREELPLSRFIGVLQDEMIEMHGEVANFASLLRVTCLRYLSDPERHASEVAQQRMSKQREARAELA